MDPFHDLDIPVELVASLQRHREHLAKLAVNLRAAGVGQEQIEQSISVLIASYKAELTAAMKRMVRYGDSN
jgi:hypothetical protein